MGILEKIQSKSQKEKLRLIWAIAGITTLLLIALWIFAYKFQKTREGGMFRNIGSQVKDEQNFYDSSLKNNGVEIQDKYKFFK